MTDSLTAIIRRFPMHELALRRLNASDAEFRQLCEHYALAKHALSNWRADPVRAKEYRVIIQEIEEEAVEFIDGRHPHQRTKC